MHRFINSWVPVLRVWQPEPRDFLPRDEFGLYSAFPIQGEEAPPLFWEGKQRECRMDIAVLRVCYMSTNALCTHLSQSNQQRSQSMHWMKSSPSSKPAVRIPFLVCVRMPGLSASGVHTIKGSKCDTWARLIVWHL